MTWRRDCRHFVGDRPCRPHKLTGVLCDACDQYAPGGRRILIVKLAAVGDVLRSTAILRGVRDAFGPCTISWVTQRNAVGLFAGNREVDRVIPFDGALPLPLASEEFDLVLNLDAAPDSCALASAARASARRGFALGADGKPMPLHAEAEPWFEMGLLDAKKRDNHRSYQALMFDILGITPRDPELILELSAEERAFGDGFLHRHGLKRGDPIVGLNTGAGGRWPLKKWTVAGYRALIDRLHEHGASVVLLGGPDEAARNRELRQGREHKVIDAGCDNTLRQFAALVDTIAVMVSGDTLAMHIAIARRKHLVVMFGPTSADEIELYGRGEKIQSTQMDCLCCYLTACDKDPNCMNTIAEQTVFDATVRMLARARSAE